ncbi:hypothetical protein M409DRAFT_71505 [Zasmidium cellare ATCC 36951]|uniref:Major facilitator superfamily (MFS) profile domain-containing protein n=1 Tax=Zasmidium cellare ATCC 36951 TaxID=1080233 RepID=A0A6A6BV90_ZASCE|nr:uncharacterized protein M409DRAFT_71505 [Zasmidium cellare ATCC 36951]KAF2158714.1 hypothetical protein M409DRAFT_71505 [Zasmidium cellare ATCC 36951]
MIFVNLAQLIQMYPYGSGISSAVSIATSLYYNVQTSTQIIPPEAEAQITHDAAWIAAAYPLTQGTFVLMGGRLGEVYGHKTVLMGACAWWLVWNLVAGFAPGVITLCVFRGLSGIGGGLITPNAVALLGVTFPPGRKRNLAMGLFGAMAPVGAAGASVVAPLLVQLTEWKWAFFLIVIVGVVVFSLMVVSLPWDRPVDGGGKIDWVGAYLGVGGLILFNFVWNQAPGVGWTEPYIYILLIVSLLHLAAFLLWEAKFAPSPILPFSIWKAPSFKLMLLIVFFSFMSMGIFLWYFSLIGLNIRHYSIIENGANYQPLTVLGTAAAFLSAWLIPRLPAQYIIAIGNVALIICNVLLATTPRHQTYWAMMFPAIICAAFTVDFIFAASQIIASGSVGKKHQGVAGSLIGTLLSYGLSTGLGFAGTVESYTNDGGRDLLGGYRHALYLAIGMAGFGLVSSLLFLRMPKNTKEGWDEKGDETGGVV